MEQVNKPLLNGLPHRIVAFVAGAALLLGVAFAATATVGEEAPDFDTGDPTADYILSCMMRDQMGVSTQALGPDTSSYEGKYVTRYFYREVGYSYYKNNYYYRDGTSIYPTTDNNIYGVVAGSATISEYSRNIVSFNQFDTTSTCDFYVKDLGISGVDYSISGSFTTSYLLQETGTVNATDAVGPSSCYLLVNGNAVGGALSISGNTVTVPDTLLSSSDYPSIDSVGFRCVYSKEGGEISKDYSITVNGLYSFNISGLKYEVVGLPPTYPIPEEQYNGLIGAIDRVQAAVSEPSPMDKFEGEYLENFGGQIDKTEQALSPTNPALPNNGDVGGFTQDIQQTMGINGSSFNAQEFADAVSGISGADATGDAGIWQFFTQQVADDLATPSGSTRDVPYPEGELEDYIKAAEGWLSKW